MRIYLGTLIILLLTACSPESVQMPETTQTSMPTLEYLQPTFIPTQGDPTQMSPFHLTPNSGLEGLVEIAKEDLAQQLSISITQINLVEVEEAEWSDSSLDCPQPGMSYLPVVTPGYRIVLQTNNQIHEYHSNRDSYFVYCENRVPPIIPQPNK